MWLNIENECHKENTSSYWKSIQLVKKLLINMNKFANRRSKATIRKLENTFLLPGVKFLRCFLGDSFITNSTLLTLVCFHVPDHEWGKVPLLVKFIVQCTGFRSGTSRILKFIKNAENLTKLTKIHQQNWN